MKSWMQTPVVRIILALTLVLGTLLIFALLIQILLGALSDVAWLAPFEGVLYAVPLNAAMVAAYCLYGRWIEKREVVELGRSGALRGFFEGLLLGAGLLTAVVGLLWLPGYYRVEGLNHYTVIFLPLATMLAQSLGEELIFRVILFRIIEEGLGSWMALLISSALFGLGHLGNPAATWISTLAIALEAGILLGAVYMLTRSIWMAWGLHFAWNFTQGPIFGIQVSGTTQTGLLASETMGPDLVTGGAFGVEASLITVVLCLAAGTALLVRAKSAGHFYPYLKSNPPKADH